MDRDKMFESLDFEPALPTPAEEDVNVSAELLGDFMNRVLDASDDEVSKINLKSDAFMLHITTKTDADRHLTKPKVSKTRRLSRTFPTQLQRLSWTTRQASTHTSSVKANQDPDPALDPLFDKDEVQPDGEEILPDHKPNPVEDEDLAEGDGKQVDMEKFD